MTYIQVVFITLFLIFGGAGERGWELIYAKGYKWGAEEISA